MQNNRFRINHGSVLKPCRDPGLFRTHASSPDLNQGPSNLQSDALPTELSRQITVSERKKIAKIKLKIVIGRGLTKYDNSDLY